MFGGTLPAGSLADFDAEEARLRKLSDEELIVVMDRSLRCLSGAMAGLSMDRINSPITYYEQPSLPRLAATNALIDLHEHLGQVVSYARVNQVVPPWSRKTN